MDADHVHCFLVHYLFMRNYAGQQTSRYHIDVDHRQESYLVSLFCDAGY